MSRSFGKLLFRRPDPQIVLQNDEISAVFSPRWVGRSGPRYFMLVPLVQLGVLYRAVRVDFANSLLAP